MPSRVRNLRAKIQARTKELGVETRYTPEAHFYYVPEAKEVFGSVTGEHRNIKDPSIRNFEKNEALRYVRANYQQFRPENIEEHLKKAAVAPIMVRDDAGSAGTYIHDCRQIYFQKWINMADEGDRPVGTIEDIAKARTDIPKELYLSVISGCAGLDKFLNDIGYIPLGCEIYVYDTKDKVAGALDDVGIIANEVVLLDVKSSNQLKDTYTLQVMRYRKMFVKLFGVRPKKTLIVKTSKTDRTYQLEWFKPEQQKHGNKANFYLNKFNYHWEKIKEVRKSLIARI